MEEERFGPLSFDFASVSHCFYFSLDGIDMIFLGGSLIRVRVRDGFKVRVRDRVSVGARGGLGCYSPNLLELKLCPDGGIETKQMHYRYCPKIAKKTMDVVL